MDLQAYLAFNYQLQTLSHGSGFIFALALAKQTQMKWNIGCSGFSYKEWKGEFYPEELPQSKWFVYYFEHFNTLELNAGFYI